MIPLAILCAVLVLVLVYTLGAVKNMGDKIKELQDFAAVQNDLMAIDAINLSTAYAILHDDRHKGKMGNQAAWQKARDEWSAKVKGVKA